MKKPFYKSMTFWGSFGWAVVGALEAFVPAYPELARAAQAIAAALVAFGIRRAIK